MIYPNTQQEAKKQLDKAIKNNDLIIEMLEKVNELIKTINHKTITKRAIDIIRDKTGYSSSLSTPYNSIQFKLYLNERIYSKSAPDKNGVSGSEYFDTTDETLYLDNVTPQHAQEEIQKRLEYLKEYQEQLKKERDQLPELIKQVEELAKKYNDLDNLLTYKTRKAIGLTK